MSDKSLKANLDLQSKLSGNLDSNKGGFDSTDKLRAFLKDDKTSTAKIEDALTRLKASVTQADKDVADFFEEDLENESEDEEAVSINITITGGGKLKVN